MCVCVRLCVLVLCLCCWFSGRLAVLALDVGDLQDGQQELKCILDVVGAVGTLQTGELSSSSSSSSKQHYHHHLLDGQRNYFFFKTYRYRCVFRYRCSVAMRFYCEQPTDTVSVCLD